MELKTDKIHRILNTPYDELRPDDFDAAQEQLETLTSKSRGVQTDAWRWIEQQSDALKAEHDTQLFDLRSQVSDLEQSRGALADQLADLEHISKAQREAIDALTQERDDLKGQLAAAEERIRQQYSLLQDEGKAIEGLLKERDRTREQRDQLQGICERLKRELEEAKSDILAVRMTSAREHEGKVASLERALVDQRHRHEAHVAVIKRSADERIKHLESAVDDIEGRLRQAEKERDELRSRRDRLASWADGEIDKHRKACDRLTAERDAARLQAAGLTQELDDLRQAPSGTAKQAERIREIEDKLCVVVDAHAKQVAGLEHTIGLLRLDVERKNAGLQQVTVDLTELEQAKAQAENASSIAMQLAAERDAVKEREHKLLWLLAGATERAERAERQAKDERERRERYREIDDRAIAMLREQHAKDLEEAREVMGLGPAGRPAITPIACPGCGGIGKQNTDHDCAATREALQLAEIQLQAIRDLPLNERGGPMATSADGKSWWCPRCQASLVPGKLHQCPAATCSMFTPDGRCTAPPAGGYNGQPFCSRHLDAVRAVRAIARDHEVQQTEVSDKLPQ